MDPTRRRIPSVRTRKPGEDLTFQYLNAASSWVTLETFARGRHAGPDPFTRNYTMPVLGLAFANFQVRFVYPGDWQRQ